MDSTQTESDGRAVVVFDGVCNMCNGSVNWIIDHDPDAQFVFVALQSEAGMALRTASGLADGVDSLTLIERGTTFIMSDAVLHIGGRLKTVLAPLARLARIVPRPIRDACYKLIARNRYSLFGKEDACRVPTPELRARFLDPDDVKSAMDVAGFTPSALDPATDPR